MTTDRNSSMAQIIDFTVPTIKFDVTSVTFNGFSVARNGYTGSCTNVITPVNCHAVILNTDTTITIIEQDFVANQTYTSSTWLMIFLYKQ